MLKPTVPCSLIKEFLCLNMMMSIIFCNGLTFEKIKNLLKKIWLTEFHKYCMENLSDISQQVMSDLLKFESDCMTLQIIYNSLDIKGLSDARGREGERKKYINALGYLYPDRDRELTEADTFDKLKDAVRHTVYEEMLN